MSDEPYNTPPQPLPESPSPQPSSGIGKNKKKKRLIIIGSSVAVVLFIGGIVWAMLYGGGSGPTLIETPPPSPTPTPTPANLPSNLDGVLVPTSLATRHPLAIMIENLPVARPQAGLVDASIVYEAIAEGGITRFMAVYGHTVPEKAGPVRSARVVFLDYAQEYTPVSAYYAHVGGAANALEKIKTEKLYDLDQFAIGAKAFQRFPKPGVATEHTMYTFPEKLYGIAATFGYKTESNFQSWKFKDDIDATSRPESQTITIPFSSAAYTVKYTYDKLTNSYKRFQAGIEHKDATTGKQISPKNVVIVYAPYQTIMSGGKEVQKVGVVGEGNAAVFRDGKFTEAKWKKTSTTSRTQLLDAATGLEIELNRGQTFFEVPKVGTATTVQ